MKKNSLMFYIGMAVSLAFLGWAVAKLDFVQAFEAIMRLNPLWLIPYLLVYLIPVWLRAVRLRLITEPVTKAPMRTIISSICIGFMGNMIFPLRIGELIRVYVVAKKERVSRSGIFATIVVERIFDIFATAMLVVAAVFYATPLTVDAAVWRNVERVAAVFGVVSLGAGVTVFLVAAEEGFALRWLSQIIRRLPAAAAVKIEGLLASFRQGLQVMRNGRHFGLTLLYTAALFAGAIASSYLVLPLFGIPAGFEQALVLCVFTMAGVAVPSAPGAVGTFHAGVIFALTLYGVDANKALGAAIFVHLFMFTFYLVTGGWYVWRDKMTFAELRHSADS